MACNILLKTHFAYPETIGHSSGTTDISEVISVPIVRDGKVTDEYIQTTVTKTVDVPLMLIDQTISADDLSLRSQIENGINLKQVDYHISSDDININTEIVNRMVSEIRSHKPDMQTPPPTPENVESNN